MKAKTKLSTADFRRTFNEAATLYRGAFPRQLKDLVVALNNKPVFVSPAVAEKLSADIIKDALAPRLKRMRQIEVSAMAGETFASSGQGFHYVIFDSCDDSHFYVSEKLSSRIDIITLLDHEIGHLVVKGGAYGGGYPAHVRECMADSYAALRHFQRFGDSTDYAAYAPASLAWQVTVLDSKIHYTSAAIQAVVDMWKKDPKKILALSLQETATLANRMALENALQPRVLNKVYKAYAPVRKLYEQKIKRPERRKKAAALIVKILHAYANDADIRTAGMLTLKDPVLWKNLSDADRKFVSKISPPPAPLQTAKTPNAPR